jgi:hypothetical protein
MTNNEIITAVIATHRKMMSERYDYQRVKSVYKLAPNFTEDKAAALHDYLIEYIYPDQEKRLSINRAFDSLDDHIRHPSQLARIIIDSTALIIKYSRHLPKIMNVGYKALLSFRAASRYEKQLYNAALESEIALPYSTDDIRAFVAGIPTKDVEKLVDLNLDLLEILLDKSLVNKTIEMIDNLLIKMKKRPNVYAKEEITAIIVGRDIIAKAQELFDMFETRDQHELIALIERIEKDDLHLPL